MYKLIDIRNLYTLNSYTLNSHILYKFFLTNITCRNWIDKYSFQLLITQPSKSKHIAKESY